MQKNTEERTRRLGRPRDDNFEVVDMSITCNDDTSNCEENSNTRQIYRLSDLEGVGEPHSMIGDEGEEVDINEAACVVLDTLDLSEDENYVSCNEDTVNSSTNRYGDNERINPREFIPILSTEFNQICQLLIDGDTLERRITEQFLLMSQGFKHCESAYLQTLYSQVEQQLCTEAILASLNSIQSQSHGARHHEQSLWTNLKDILDARFTLTNDQE